MKQTGKVLSFLRDCVELYIPVVTFSGLFLVFVLQVFCRYILRNPQPWASEVTSICFLWTVMLGACYTQHKKSHVMFTLINDVLPPRLKALTAILGNLVILVAFGLCVVPTWNFVLFMAVQKTSILKIGMHIVYMPYMAFLLLVIIYTIIEMYDDLKAFMGAGGGKQ